MTSSSFGPPPPPSRSVYLDRHDVAGSQSYRLVSKFLSMREARLRREKQITYCRCMCAWGGEEGGREEGEGRGEGGEGRGGEGRGEGGGGGRDGEATASSLLPFMILLFNSRPVWLQISVT